LPDFRYPLAKAGIQFEHAFLDFCFRRVTAFLNFCETLKLCRQKCKDIPSNLHKSGYHFLRHGGGMAMQQGMNDMAGSTIMGAILLALGAFVGYQGIDLTLGTPGHPGPGFVPFGLGLIFTLLAAVYLWQSSRGKEKKKIPSSPSDYRRTVMAVGTISLYALAVSWLGYILTTFLLFVIWLSLIERKRWLQTASLACLAVIAVYFFNVLFSVQLPAGLLKGIIR
jgi:hypothetical protein